MKTIQKQIAVGNIQQVNGSRIFAEAADHIIELEQQLAASQAREKVLVSEINALIDRFDSEGGFEGWWAWDITVKNMANVLAEPTDDTALKALLKAERERCAKVCASWLHADGDQCAEAIRALEDE